MHSKTVALIPALLGGTRVPDKNILLVDGYPLVFHAARACHEAGVFDEVCLSAEEPIFEKMAQMMGVTLHRRSPERGGTQCRAKNKSGQCHGERCRNIEHLLADFMSALGPCAVTLVQPVAPLLKGETIRQFVETLHRSQYDSLLCVEERHTEVLAQTGPVNFSTTRFAPHEVAPVRLLSWAMAGWNSTTFLEAYAADDSMAPAAVFCGRTGYFTLDRIQALQADTWDGLRLVEAALQYRRHNGSPGQHRFTENILDIQWDVPSLVAEDGVTKFEARCANSTLTDLSTLKAKMGPPPWLYILVRSGTDSTGIFCQGPGEGARRHCHVTHDEWWVVLEGAFEWRLDGGQVVRAKQGDAVFLPRGTVHSIACVSPEPGLRLACGGFDMEHVYVR